MKRLHIIGGKNHGKTTLIVDLVQELTRRGVRVGTIKHTHHHHELDVPGKDSHRHRVAGAKVVGIVSPQLNAVYLPAETGDTGEVDCYTQLGPLFSECELVLVEGDSHTQAPKLEVWRRELGTEPRLSGEESLLAVITDDKLPEAPHVLPRSDLSQLVEWICQHFLQQS